MNWIQYLYIGLLNGFISGVMAFILNTIIKNKKNFISTKGRDYLDMGTHSTKHTIPTMGGLAFFILIPIILLFYPNIKNAIFISLSASLSGIVGGIDDWLKLKRGKGLCVKSKFILQALAALVPGIFYFFIFGINQAYINFFGYHFYIHFFIIFWIALVIMSTTHAVNLTDGIDGLAILTIIPSIIIALSICEIKNPYHIIFSYLFMTFWQWNKHPAKIFMGDIGAFFLGGYLSGLFLIKKTELLLPFAGIVFVGNTLSVILQYLSWKLRNKKIFLFTPYHHALEKKGYSENQICIIYMIIQIIGCIMSLFLCKKYFD